MATEATAKATRRPFEDAHAAPAADGPRQTGHDRQELIQGQPRQVVPRRPRHPLGAVLAPPVGDRLVGEEPVAVVAKTDREEGDRHHHGGRDARENPPPVAHDPVDGRTPCPPETRRQQQQTGNRPDQGGGDKGVFLGGKGKPRPHPDPDPGTPASVDRPPHGDKGARGHQHLEQVHAKKSSVVEPDRRDGRQERGPPGRACAENPARCPRHRDDQDTGEGDRQPRGEVRVAGEGKGGGGEVVEQRSVVGRVVLVGAVFEQHIRGVGVDGLVVVVRAPAKVPQMEGQRHHDQQQPRGTPPDPTHTKHHVRSLAEAVTGFPGHRLFQF